MNLHKNLMTYMVLVYVILGSDEAMSPRPSGDAPMSPMRGLESSDLTKKVNEITAELQVRLIFWQSQHNTAGVFGKACTRVDFFVSVSRVYAGQVSKICCAGSQIRGDAERTGRIA